MPEEAAVGADHGPVAELEARTEGPPEAPTGEETVPPAHPPRVVTPGRSVHLRRPAVQDDRAPDTAEDVEVGGEDGAGRTRGALEGARGGDGQAGVVVLDPEVHPASVALEDEAQAAVVEEQPLGAGGHAETGQAVKGQPLVIVSEAGPVLVVDAAPQVGRAPVGLVADAVVATQSAVGVAPGEVSALLPVDVVTGRVETLVLSAERHGIEYTYCREPATGDPPRRDGWPQRAPSWGGRAGMGRKPRRDGRQPRS
jgi:hypothetical protein